MWAGRVGTEELLTRQRGRSMYCVECRRHWAEGPGLCRMCGGCVCVGDVGGAGSSRLGEEKGHPYRGRPGPRVLLEPSLDVGFWPPAFIDLQSATTPPPPGWERGLAGHSLGRARGHLGTWPSRADRSVSQRWSRSHQNIKRSADPVRGRKQSSKRQEGAAE